MEGLLIIIFAAVFIVAVIGAIVFLFTVHWSLGILATFALIALLFN